MNLRQASGFRFAIILWILEIHTVRAEDCVCSNGPCAINLTCEFQRIGIRPDCPCCPVCTQILAEDCNDKFPCNQDDGLTCSNNGKCQGTTPAPNANNLSDLESVTENTEIIPTEMLSESHAAEVEPPSTETNKKIDKKATTLGSSESMKVAISDRTPTSASIKLPVLDEGAVLSIGISSSANESTADWKKHIIPPEVSTLILSDLIPKTTYTLKYAIGNHSYDTVEFTTPNKDAHTLPSVSSISGSRVSMVENSVEDKHGCISDNKTFAFGEEYLDGCSYKCHCEESGEFLCLPRCNYRHDEYTGIPVGCKLEKDLSDPLCCSLLICDDEQAEIKKQKASLSSDGCIYKNKTYSKEEKFTDGCEQQCTCFNNGDVTCQPRCPPTGAMVIGDNDCITLPDPSDSCCKVTVCGNETVSDVWKEAIELEKKRLAAEKARILSAHDDSRGWEAIERSRTHDTLTVKISSVIPINDSSLLISIQIPEDDLAGLKEEQNIQVLYATKADENWSEVNLMVKELFVEGSNELHAIVGSLDTATQYYVKIQLNGTESNVGSASTTKSNQKSLIERADRTSEDKKDSSPSESIAACSYKSQKFAANEEFYDGCEEYCLCEETGAVSCIPIECPTGFGLDLIDSECVTWEPSVTTAGKSPPDCCHEMKCVRKSICTYEGLTFSNFEEIPMSLSGCGKRCYCEYGNVSCQNTCPPITSTPPNELPCSPTSALRMPLPHQECCEAWACPLFLQNATNEDTPTALLNSTHSTINSSMSLFPSHLDQHREFIKLENGQKNPPSAETHPSVIPLEKLGPESLDALFHGLTLQHNAPNPSGNGVYVSVRREEDIRDLKKGGAKFVGDATDGSVVLFLPAKNRLSSPKLTLNPSSNKFPFGPDFPNPHRQILSHGRISDVLIRPLDESTLHIDFTVPPVFVGLQGAVEILYTNEFGIKPDPAQWEKQLFQQPEDIIDNSHLQLFLSGLEPDSNYHVQIKVIIPNVQNFPISDIFLIRTPPAALPSEIKIDLEIRVISTTSRTAEISWRRFSHFESALIDGVRIQYKSYEDKMYTTTGLLHRSLSSYKLVNLQPDKNYEVDLLLVPFTNQTTELISQSAVHIKTLPEIDDFSFVIDLESGKIGENAVELVWEGVPFPEDKFVSIYQVMYQRDNQMEQNSYFKVADRETSKRAQLAHLKPGTRYRIWLKAFLTNGKKKRSNEIYVMTKVGSLPPSGTPANRLNLSSGSRGVARETTSYYGALVALAIVATVSVIGIIVLLMILIKKQNLTKIPINDRKSESSYDNPSFKNYDMEANGHQKQASELYRANII